MLAYIASQNCPQTQHAQFCKGNEEMSTCLQFKSCQIQNESLLLQELANQQFWIKKIMWALIPIVYTGNQLCEAEYK